MIWFKLNHALRHARPCAGHPRLDGISKSKDVDGRDKPGHDESAIRSDAITLYSGTASK